MVSETFNSRHFSFSGTTHYNSAKGGDWQVEQIAGHECVLDNGGQVMSLDFLDGHSTTSIIEKISSRNL